VSQLKLGNPQFSKPHEKYLKNINQHNSLHLARKYAHGQILLLQLDIICSSKFTVFLKLKLSEHYLPLGTDNVCMYVCRKNNIQAYFQAKQRPFFIYTKYYYIIDQILSNM